MSDAAPKPYKLDHGHDVKEQIHAVKIAAKQAGKGLSQNNMDVFHFCLETK